MVDVERVRWTDDRLDDFATNCRDIMQAVDAMRNVVAAHDIQLVEIDRRRRARSGFVGAVAIALLTVVTGQIVTIVAVLEKVH